MKKSKHESPWVCQKVVVHFLWIEKCLHFFGNDDLAWNFIVSLLLLWFKSSVWRDLHLFSFFCTPSLLKLKHASVSDIWLPAASAWSNFLGFYVKHVHLRYKIHHVVPSIILMFCREHQRMHSDQSARDCAISSWVVIHSQCWRENSNFNFYYFFIYFCFLLE